MLSQTSVVERSGACLTPAGHVVCRLGQTSSKIQGRGAAAAFEGAAWVLRQGKSQLSPGPRHFHGWE